MLAIRTILHATDFSTYSDRAFRLACSLARDYGARLVILHVAAPPVAPYAEGIVLPLLPETYLDKARHHLAQIRSSDPQIAIEHRLAEGDAATEIVRLAREIPCDVIVLGTHGRTGLGRLLLGSVAEKVLRHAACPVITIRTPIAEAQPVSAADREPGAR